MSEDNRIVKSMELYRNGNVKRIEFYEPTQQPQFISSVFGSPQGTAKTYEVSSGSYTTTGSTGAVAGSSSEVAMNDSNEELYEHEIVSSGILSGGGELYSIAGDAKICYICGNKCEVMQSMMHASHVDMDMPAIEYVKFADAQCEFVRLERKERG